MLQIMDAPSNLHAVLLRMEIALDVFDMAWTMLLKSIVNNKRTCTVVKDQGHFSWKPHGGNHL